jgi:uncharacterized protein (DUF924 family)
MTANDVLSFWFNEIKPEQWFVKDLEFDQLIIENFTQLHAAANQCELYSWRSTAKGRLAEIIVLDQFSRNMFRDTPQAFSSDALALALAQEAIAIGADQELSAIERSFLYMPFMHSESLLIHQEALVLYTNNGIASNLDFELQHKKIIEQFGRYPHRNKILGRSSSEAEIHFLTQPGSAF